MMTDVLGLRLWLGTTVEKEPVSFFFNFKAETVLILYDILTTGRKQGRNLVRYSPPELSPESASRHSRLAHQDSDLRIGSWLGVQVSDWSKT